MKLTEEQKQNIINEFEQWKQKTYGNLNDKQRKELGAFHTNSRYILSEYPFMPTYSRPWTDEDLYNYFGLTPEEVEEIESFVTKQ